MQSRLSHQSATLKLFRDIWRAANLMPTAIRRDFIRDKCRKEFREAADDTDPYRIRQNIAYGETMLDTIKIQAKHLNAIHGMSPDDIRRQAPAKAKVPVIPGGIVEEQRKALGLVDHAPSRTRASRDTTTNGQRNHHHHDHTTCNHDH